MRPLPLLAALFVIGCQPPSATTAPADAATSPVAASSSPAVVAPPPPAASSATARVASGLPPLAASAASKADAAKASALNTRALREHIAGKYDASAKGFEDASRADPANVLARYNLGSALARKGDAERALAVLADLAESPVCERCKKQLAWARQDPDFAAVTSHPRFVELTARAVVGDLDPKVVTDAVTTAIATARAGNLGAFVRDETPVKFEITDSLADDGRDKRRDTKQGAAAVTRAVGLARRGTDIPMGFSGMDAPKCDATCCAQKGQALLHNSLYLTRVCVEHDDQGRGWLRQVDVLDGD